MMSTHGVHAEPIIEAELPIIDPHHHLWLIPPAALAAMRKPESFIPVARSKARYLFEDFLARRVARHPCG